MMDKINFIFVNICVPLILSIFCLKNLKKQKLNYELTKGVYYLLYGVVVAVDYLFCEQIEYIAGFTVTIAIMEGVPLLLKEFLKKDK